MHLADTRDKAIDDCTYGLQDFANYFGAAGFVPLSNSVRELSPRGNSWRIMRVRATAASAPLATRWHTSRICWISPAGSVPCCCLATTGASPQATYHSYELFAREVMPHFKVQLVAPRASHDWAKDMRDQLLGRAGEAIVKAINEHTDELKMAAERADGPES